MKEGPYGYTYIPRTGSCPGKLIINEAEVDVVRMIFRLLIDEQLSAYQITVEEFCRNISAALDNPSFETKQKIAAPGSG